MDTDLYFVVGVVMAVFALPAIVSAFSDGRAPRVAAIAILIAGGLIAVAVNERPSAYGFEQLPDVFVRVIGRYF